MAAKRRKTYVIKLCTGKEGHTKLAGQQRQGSIRRRDDNDNDDDDDDDDDDGQRDRTYMGSKQAQNPCKSSLEGFQEIWGVEEKKKRR